MFVAQLYHLLTFDRSRDLNQNAEEFWTQGDFGYVKKEVDSLKTLCKPQGKVCTCKTGPGSLRPSQYSIFTAF